MRIPEGTDERDFQAALGEFANVVGRDWVFTKDEDVALYRDAYSPFFGQPDKAYDAGAAVAPASVEQVQDVVRIANRYKVPLCPISTGRNLGYGGSAPTMPGAVVLDLKRMDKILEVNELEGYMIVEPGVSFIDAHRHLQSIGSSLRVSSPQPGWGSPIGNALDHGVGAAAIYGDNFSMVKGLEVVLPNGELLRTGCGAVPGSKLWGLNEYGFGPHVTGMFSQANFGVVTKAVFWLRPNWEAEQSFTIESFRGEDMQSYIDVLFPLRNRGILNGFGITSPIRESMSTNDGRIPYGVPAVHELLLSRDGGSHEQWNRLGEENNIPSLRGTGALRGHPDVVAAQLEVAREACKALPGTFKVGPVRNGKDWPGPSIDFGIIAIQGPSHGHYYFSPIFRANAEEIFAINDLIRRIMIDENDIDMLKNFGWSGSRGAGQTKHMLILMEMLVHDDVELNEKRVALFRRMVRECGAHGWPEYRAGVYFMDDVVAQFSFANHSLRRFHEMIKDAVDPNGVLAPGKSGIWPKRLRKA